MRTPLDLVAVPFAGYANHTPSHRGKARLLRAAREVLGARRMILPGGIALAMRVDSAMDMSYFRVAAGEQSEAAFDLVHSLQHGDCFIDVGANIGFHTTLASRAVGPSGRVLSVEPSAREYARLRDAIRWNGCTNVISFHAALAARAGTAALRVDPCHTGVNHLSDDASNSEIVPVYSGDALLTPFVGVTQRTFVKIDVEGAEGPAIEGLAALLSRVETTHVVVEVSERFVGRGGTRPDEIYSRMRECGLSPTTRVSERSDQYDELFVR